MGKTTIFVCKKIFDWILNNITLVVFLGVGLFLNYQEIEYEPRIIFMDVGQGDAILLIDSSGKKILIDGGGGDYVVYAMSNYLHPRDRTIDTIVLTHPHEDHLSGLIDILERYTVDEALYYPACYNSSLYDYFLNLDENFQTVSPDYHFSGKDFSLNLLFPKDEVPDGECLEFSNVNNASIVVRLESDSGSILLTGDAEHEVEDWLMSNYTRDEIKSDVLKAGHHCSRTASSEKFLKYIEPKYAICSVGEENKFGHPHDEVIENFENLGIKYDLTFEVGDIIFEL